MRAQRQSPGVGRHMFGIGVAILVMLLIGLIQPVGARADLARCENFDTQQEAQAVLDQNPEFDYALDSDGDGIACEELPAVDPSPTDDFTSCEQFVTQGDAQRELNKRTDDSLERRFALDADGDGVACEDTFGVRDGERTEDLRTCDDFANQEEAQAYFDNEATDLQGSILDPDGDFLACEDALGGQVAVDPFSCGMFGSRDAAQAALDADPELSEFLDEDGDGIACEEFGTDGPVVVVCNKQLGTLVEVLDSEEVLSGLDFPFRRATQAEIEAGTCGATVPLTPDAPSDDNEPDEKRDSDGTVVVTLPKTGAGAADEQARQGPLLAATLTSLVLTMGAIGLRSRLPRARA